MTLLKNLDFATGGIKPSKSNYGIEIPSFGDPRQQEFVFNGNIPNPILKNTIPDFNPGPIPQVSKDWSIFDSPKLNLPDLNLPTFGNTNQIFESVLDNIKPFNPIVPSNPTNGLSDFWNIFDLPQIDAPVFTIPTFGSGTKEIQISGQVVDVFGEPIPGVNVSVANNSTIGVSTDYNGKYSLKVKENDVIRFGYVGYKVQNVNAKQANAKIILNEEASSTGEIIVTSKLTKNQPTTMVAKKSNTVLYGALGLAALFLLLKKPSKETKKATKTTKGLASVTI